MRYQELIGLFERGRRRWHSIGDQTNGIVIGLDLESRFFTIFNGEVVSRVNPKAFSGDSADTYDNPGGDPLWPAPEGTTHGYEYPTGNWRVPPSILGARYSVVDSKDNCATIRSEIDIINNSGLGVPTAFERKISVENNSDKLTVRVEEGIEYLGTKELSCKECLLAPWTLAQFDNGPGCEVVFPYTGTSSVWDLYDPSDSQRLVSDGCWHIKTDGSQRFQLALASDVPWIEFRNPIRGFSIRRIAEGLPLGQDYIDIIDATPTQQPGNKGVRYSVYSDTTGLMEIEAVGGCSDKLLHGTVLKLTVSTVYCCSE